MNEIIHRFNKENNTKVDVKKLTNLEKWLLLEIKRIQEIASDLFKATK